MEELQNLEEWGCQLENLINLGTNEIVNECNIVIKVGNKKTAKKIYIKKI